MHNFRALELSIKFYEQTAQLQITGNLKDQLDRAASSISLNLAEGNAKGSAKNKRHFFQIAYGSLRECQTIFRLLKVQNENLVKDADHLGACLYRLINSEIKDSPNWIRSSKSLRS